MFFFQNTEFFAILAFLVICVFLGFLLLIIPNVLIPKIKTNNLEKFSAFECGFDPFQDTRSTFDVRFYLVAILFIIFDIEITFLIPWAISLGYLSVYSFIVMLLFLFILLVGFFYEWSKGALDW